MYPIFEISSTPFKKIPLFLHIANKKCSRTCLEEHPNFREILHDHAYTSLKLSDDTGDLTRRKALAWTAFWKLEKIWRSSTISIATKVKLFNVTCVTVFLYGCDSWILSTSMESKINAFATSCYRIMLNIKRVDRVTNAKVYQMSGTQPLITTVRQHQLRFLGHILRRPEDEPCRRYALFTPSHGKRRPGRQATSYISYIQKLLGDTDRVLEPEAIASLAQNRSESRKFVDACSAAEWLWWWLSVVRSTKNVHLPTVFTVFVLHC